MSKQFEVQLKTSPIYKLRRDPIVEPMELSDGTPAVLHTSEFDRADKNRLSFYLKLACLRNDKTGVVASGWVICGQGGARFVKESGVLQFVRASVTSLVCKSASHPSIKELLRANSLIKPTLFEAMSKTATAMEMGDDDEAQAISLLRDAIEASDIVSAAYNDLSWLLLTAKDPSLVNAQEALKYAAKAVELTERKEVAFLDTLALALYREGRLKEAISTQREALALMPEEEILQQHLKEYESAEQRMEQRK